ncbi:MAG: hypothetical protein V1853_02360 [bacterium]
MSRRKNRTWIFVLILAVICLAGGALAGHFYWPMKVSADSESAFTVYQPLLGRDYSLRHAERIRASQGMYPEPTIVDAMELLIRFQDSLYQDWQIAEIVYLPFRNVKISEVVPLGHCTFIEVDGIPVALINPAEYHRLSRDPDRVIAPLTDFESADGSLLQASLN